MLFSIAKALRERGNRVIYFAGYKKGEDLFKREEIETATDQVQKPCPAAAHVDLRGGPRCDDDGRVVYGNIASFRQRRL